MDRAEIGCPNSPNRQSRIPLYNPHKALSSDSGWSWIRLVCKTPVYNTTMYIVSDSCKVKGEGYIP